MNTSVSMIQRVLMASVAAGLALAFVGCSFKPLKIAVQPDIALPQTNIGQGKEIAVTVVDQRENSRLGYRRISDKQADISAESPLATTLESLLVEGLALQGFKPTGTVESSVPHYELQIVKTDYITDAAAVKAKMTLDTELRAVVALSDKVVRKSYIIEREENMAFAPMADDNAEFINKALGKTLQSALEDEALLQQLAQ